MRWQGLVLIVLAPLVAPSARADGLEAVDNSQALEQLVRISAEVPMVCIRDVMSLVVVTGLAAGAVSAHAEPGAGAAAAPPTLVAIKEVTATSTFPDKRDAYAAWRTVAYELREEMGEDPVLWTAWCEGAKTDGLGETVTLTFAEPTQLDAVRIAAGVWRTDRLFEANNQVTALQVVADGKRQTVKPKGKQWVTAQLGGKVTTLAFTISGVKRGKMNEACISGIDLVRGGEVLVPVIGVDAKATASLASSIAEIDRALAAPGRKGLQPLLEFPFSNRTAQGFFFGASEKPHVAKSWAAVSAACQAYQKAYQKAANASGDDEGNDEDAWTDPKACPQAVSLPHTHVRAVAPGSIVVRFSAGREVADSWRLRWTDRWRLQAVSYE